MLKIFRQYWRHHNLRNLDGLKGALLSTCAATYHWHTCAVAALLSRPNTYLCLTHNVTCTCPRRGAGGCRRSGGATTTRVQSPTRIQRCGLPSPPRYWSHGPGPSAFGGQSGVRHPAGTADPRCAPVRATTPGPLFRRSLRSQVVGCTQAGSGRA